jgi:hypothetical protein
MKIKKLIAFGLVSAMLFTMGSSSAITFAKERPNTHKNQPKVIIGDTDVPVPNYIIQDLINENPNAGQINITEFSNGNNSNTTIQPMALISPGIYYTNVVKNETDSNVFVRNNFVTSVAKGQTITLGYNWSSSLSCNISGKIDKSSLGITGTLTSSYSASSTFSGPPENSQYNCRCFYVQFYESRGTYTATCHDPFPGWYITYKESGSYNEPSYYLSYNVDKIV